MVHSLLLLGVLSLAPVQVQPVVDMPFELIHNHIYLDAEVNGKKVRMLLETGSPITFVSEEIAPSLGAKPGAQVMLNGGGAKTAPAHLTSLGTLQVGAKTFKDVRAMITSFTDINRRSGSHFDGLLANDITSQFVLDIDYPARRIRLWDPATFRYEGKGSTLPATYDGHYKVEGTIKVGGKAITSKFTLDTGASASISLGAKFGKANGLPGPVKTIDPPSVAAGIGGAVSSVTGRAESITFGTQTYNEPIVTFSRDTAGFFAQIEHAGLIGNKLMSHFRVLIDKSRSTVTFELKDNEPMNADSSGMLVGREDTGDKVVVLGVLSGSPADEAGVRKGDEVVAFDGKPADVVAVRAALLRPGETHTVTMVRDGARRDVKFTTRKLI
jgi:hypothetical protein